MKFQLSDLLFWFNKTDGECLTMATNNDGVLDAGQAISYMMNRDFWADVHEELANDIKHAV